MNAYLVSEMINVHPKGYCTVHGFRGWHMPIRLLLLLFVLLLVLLLLKEVDCERRHR